MEAFYNLADKRFFGNIVNNSHSMNKYNGISMPLVIMFIAAVVIIGGGAAYYIGKIQRIIQINHDKNETQLVQPLISANISAPATADTTHSSSAPVGAADPTTTTLPSGQATVEQPSQAVLAKREADQKTIQNLQIAVIQLRSLLKSKDLELQDKASQLDESDQSLSELNAKQARSDALISGLELKLNSVQDLTVAYQGKLDVLDKQIADLQAKNLKDILNSQGQPLSLSAMSKLIADANYQIDQLSIQKDQLRQDFAVRINELKIK